MLGFSFGDDFVESRVMHVDVRPLCRRYVRANRDLWLDDKRSGNYAGFLFENLPGALDAVLVQVNKQPRLQSGENEVNDVRGLCNGPIVSLHLLYFGSQASDFVGCLSRLISSPSFGRPIIRVNDVRRWQAWVNACIKFHVWGIGNPVIFVRCWHI